MGSSSFRSPVSATVAAPHGDRVEDSAHVVQFYETDAFLVDAAARFIGSSLRAGEAAVVIATRAHRDGLEERLGAQGVDPTEARAQGRYVSLDAADTLSKIMVEGRPDEPRFTEVVGGTLRRAALNGPHRRVRAFGEMVALLSADDQREAAIHLEELWNGLAETLPLAVLCAYPIATFRAEADGEPFLRICAEHSRVIPAESWPALASSEDRLRAIAYLQQQKVSAIETEAMQRRQIEETRGWLAAIVESSDDAIVGKTLDGIVTSWNRGAERVFGYTAEEMIGRPVSVLMPPEQRDDFPRILETVRRGERVDHFDTERIRKDGRRIHVSLSVSPIKDADGRIIGAAKIARDMTGRREAEAEREQLLRLAECARAAAERANRAKDEFLAMLAHELRNPVSAVRNAVVSARLDERRRDRALEIAWRQTDHLARLVDDLLDVSRITQGRILIRKERVYLAEIIERAVDATRTLVEDFGHTLSVSLPRDDILVEGDPTRLEQVVVNLLNNATKYTERGGRIELVAERQGSQAVLIVRDNGIGIPPDVLPRVFDLFVQAERGLDRSQGGLGIGLTLVRSLVALHGGYIEAHSEGLGKGAEFVVRLPALAAEAVETPQARPTTDQGSRARARVLLVEDNPDVAESLAMLLELLGHPVRVAHDGISALKIAAANPPDVMLADIGLPGMNGYEVARRIRQHPALKGVVLVALTGYGRDEDRQQALSAGFDYHLVKPVDANALEGLVGSLRQDEPRSKDPATLH